MMTSGPKRYSRVWNTIRSRAWPSAPCRPDWQAHRCALLGSAQMIARANMLSRGKPKCYLAAIAGRKWFLHAALSLQNYVYFPEVAAKGDPNMKIGIGYEFIYHLPQPTPMILTVSIHYTRASDIIIPDHLTTDPSVPIVAYRDGFGNWCSRITAPPGRIRI